MRIVTTLHGHRYPPSGQPVRPVTPVGPNPFLTNAEMVSRYVCPCGKPEACDAMNHRTEYNACDLIHSDGWSCPGIVLTDGYCDHCGTYAL